MSLVVYGDVTSPECYLASRRADALVAAGVAVDWRAVEWNPMLPVTGRPLGPGDRAELERAMADLTALLLPGEVLPWTPPGLVPNTEAAVSGYAEAYGAGVGHDVRRLLFAAYWIDGADVGSPEVLRHRLAGPILRGRSGSSPLREFGYAVALSRGPITTDAWHRVRSWRDEWARLGTCAGLTVVADDGPPVTGETALRLMEKEIIRSGATIDHVWPDPERYPAMSPRPDRTWVSRVGGRWANAWKTSA